MKKYIFTFHTHFEAISAFKQAKSISNLANIKLIAVPRKLSSSCGTALQVEIVDKSAIPVFAYNCLYECVGESEFVKL